MKKFTLISLGLAAFAGLSWQLAHSDDDDRMEHRSSWLRTLDVAPVENQLYKDECGSCHMAYPPGLLPKRSWEKLMGGLSDHFGDNAEMDASRQAQITAYLVNNSAESSNYRRSRKISDSVATKDTPLRISEVGYIRRKHEEIPQRLIKTNKDVGSLSNCDACHQQALQGSFSEREISIPGYGRWED